MKYNQKLLMNMFRSKAYEALGGMIKDVRWFDVSANEKLNMKVVWDSAFGEKTIFIKLYEDCARINAYYYNTPLFLKEYQSTTNYDRFQEMIFEKWCFVLDKLGEVERIEEDLNAGL